MCLVIVPILRFWRFFLVPVGGSVVLEIVETEGLMADVSSNSLLSPCELIIEAMALFTFQKRIYLCRRILERHAFNFNVRQNSVRQVLYGASLR